MSTKSDQSEHCAASVGPTLAARSGSVCEVLRRVVESLNEGRPVTVATVVRTTGSTPSTPGQKMALCAGSEAVGTIGGGAVEHRVLTLMAEMQTAGVREPRVERFELASQLGMACGGAVEVMMEPLGYRTPVLIVGGGHIGSTLAPLLASLGFGVTVCDNREGILSRLEKATEFRVVAAGHADPRVLEKLAGSPPAAAAVVMTHDHKLDMDALEWALRQKFGFIGGVGSRRKAARLRSRLQQRGFSALDIERVAMPVGLDIGARSPAEISVSIAGQLIAWRSRVSAKEGQNQVSSDDGVGDDGLREKNL